MRPGGSQTRLSGNSQTGSPAGGCLCHSPCKPPRPLPRAPPHPPFLSDSCGSGRTRQQMAAAQSERGGTMCHAVLCCRALSNPQEDCAPPRPPLPESYEPDPPAIPPLPSSRAGLRPSSLHRPEDRKTNHRNGSSSVSSLTSDLTADPTRPPLCHHTSPLAVSLFTFNFHQSLMFSWEVLLWITFWFAPSHFFPSSVVFCFCSAG